VCERERECGNVRTCLQRARVVHVKVGVRGYVCVCVCACECECVLRECIMQRMC